MKTIELHLNVPLSTSGIKLSIESGELRVRLENGKLPLDIRQLNNSFDVTSKKDKQNQESSKNQSGIETSLAKGEQGVKATPREKKIAGKICQITTKGAEETPASVFEVATEEPLLKGALTNQELATMNVTAKPCEVEATFGTSRQDLKITGAKGQWLTNLIPEKREALEIALAKLLLKHKLQSPLTQVNLGYD